MCCTSPAISERTTEGVNLVTTTTIWKNQMEITNVPVKTIEFAAATEFKCEATKDPVLCEKVKALGLKNVLMKLPKELTSKRYRPPKITHVQDEEMKAPKASDKDGLINELKNGTQPMQIDCLGSSEALPPPPPLKTKRYPPPRRRNGVPVSRQFPPHCGEIYHVNNVEMNLPEASKKIEVKNLLESGAQPMQIDALSSLEMLSPPQVASKDFSLALSENELENSTQPKQIDCLGSSEAFPPPPPLKTKRYPPPRRRNGVPVSRQFPPHCGEIYHVNDVEMNLPEASKKIEVKNLLESGAQPMHFDALSSLEMLSPPQVASKGFSLALSENELENSTQPKQIDCLGSSEAFPPPPPLKTKRYPPPRRRNGVPVSRQFPPHCGEIYHVNDVEMNLPEASKKIEVKNLLESGAQPMHFDALSSLEMLSPPQVASKDFSLALSENELENSTQPKQIDSLGSSATMSPPPLNTKRYPPPRIRKGDPISREFSPHCRQNCHINNVDGAQPKKIETLSTLETLSTPQAASKNLSFALSEDYLVSRDKVMKTLDLFKELFEKLSKEHQSTSKGRQRKAAKQIHVEAAMALRRQKKCVNTSRRILGPVPGVEVGDRFCFRAELVIVGIHHPFIAGIAYMRKGKKKFATSIVESGRYANHAECSDTLVYTGQGGNPSVENTKPEDQKLKRGNLALKNSMDERTPVRVIYGRKPNLMDSKVMGTGHEKIKKIYVYDGLYLVTKYWQEREHGKMVYKFQLNRLPEQPKLPRQIVDKSKESVVHKDICVAGDISQGTYDISQGKEKIPINAVITMDDEQPPSFNYITNMIYPELYNHSRPVGCDCINGCSDSIKCPCTSKNGGEIPFNNDGALLRAKPIIYECGPSCKCPPSCNNRVSQHGIRIQLEVFKTKSMGWGVRSQNQISSGSFVCEYVGELLEDKEAEKRTGNDEYLFGIGIDEDDHNIDDGYAIDAAHHGNVGRFVNHSCSPNLYAQNVLYDHDDKRMCHVMLFATKEIRPLEELTYDYNYKVDQVRDVNGNVKKKKCCCGSRKCSRRMY